MAPMEEHPETRPGGGQALDPWFEHDNPYVVGAYAICCDKGEVPLLRRFEEANSQANLNKAALTDLAASLRSVRVLAYLLCYAPTDAASHHIRTVIFSANAFSTDPDIVLDKLVKAGHYYEQFCIRQCKSLCSFILHRDPHSCFLVHNAPGRTPPISTHPSRPSSQLTKNDILSQLVPSPKDHK